MFCLAISTRAWKLRSIDVRAGHVGDDRHQHVVAVLGGGLHVGDGRLPQSPQPSEQIHLPRRVEADRLGDVLDRTGVGPGVQGGADPAARLVVARAAPRRGAESQSRVLLAAEEEVDLAGGLEAGGGNA